MLVFLLIAFFPHPANGSNRDIQLNSTMIPAELQDAMKIVRNHVLFKQRVNINFNEFQVECVPPSDDSSHGKLIIRSKNFLKTIGDDSDVVGKRPLCPMEFRNNTIHINYNLIGTECEISTEDTQKLMETEQREIEQERRDKLISIIISIIVFLFVVIGIIFFCRKRRKSCQSTKRERIRAARTLIQASANTVIRRKVNRKISVKKVQRREVPMKRVRTKVEPVIKPPPRGELDNKETDVSTSILQHLIIQDSSVPLLSVSKSVEVVIDPQNDQSISEEPSQSEVSCATVETSQECPEDSLGSVEDKVDGKQEKESEKNVNELLVIPDRNSKRKSPKADSIKHVNDIGKKVHFEYEDYLAAYKVFDYSWRSIWNLVPVSTDKMPTMNVYKQMTETVLESLIRHKLVKENQAKKMYDEYQLFFSCSQEVKPEDGDAEMICLDSAAALSFFEGAVKKLENMYQKDGIDTKQKRLVSLPDSVLTQLRSPYGLDHFSRVYAFVTRFGYCIRVSLEIMDIISIPLLYTVALLKNVDIEVKKKALTVMREKIREIYSIFDTETIESMPFPTCFVPSLVDKYGICDENDNQLEDSDDFSELLKECSLSTKSTKKYRKKDRKTKKTRKVNNSSEV